MTVTSGSVVAMKFTFGMCDCTVDGNVVMSKFLIMLEILHMCGHIHFLLPGI